MFEIKKIGLQVPIARVNPTLLPEIQSLTAKEPARYHFTGLTCKQYNLHAGTQTLELPKVFTSQIPQRLLIAIYKQSALLGNDSLTPYFTSSDAKI